MQALTIRGLSKVYSNTVALKNIDLSIEQGDFFALLGPNGAGKSTTIGIISSLITKTAGTVKVFGHDLDETPLNVRSCIGLVPQEMNFSIFEKVIDVLLYQAGYYGIPRRMAITRAEYYLKKLDLWDKRHMKCMQLSGGMKRRLMIARALVPLVQESRLLILDEPTAGVDIELRRTTWDFLKSLNEQGTTIILTTHYLEEAEQLCKNIAIINEGKIIENTTRDQLLNQLNAETFICDLKSPVRDVPKSGVFPIQLINPYQIEVDVTYTQNLNQMFAYLQGQMIEVKSIRPKSNRLESLFLKLINTTT